MMAKKAKARSKTKARAKPKAKARVKTKRPVGRGAMSMNDSLCEPSEMSKAEAVEFYGRIIDHCQSSMEALEEEIEKAAA
jgi:hypothetical protein